MPLQIKSINFFIYMSVCYLGIGSNLGDRNAWMNFAEDQLQKKGSLIRQSSRYITLPWGFQSNHLFLNEVIVLDTSLSPLDLLAMAKEIEKKSGRIFSGPSYIDRPLDIDILFYDELILETDLLTIPHPSLHLRRFVLVPLHEIAPEFIHPVLQKNINQLLPHCPDTSEIHLDKTDF